MHVTKQISDAELFSLGVLVGQRVSAFYAEGIDVYPQQSVAPYVVIRLQGPQSGKFMIIESDWADTPKEAVDYHEMHIAIEDTPRGIKWKPEPEGNVGGTVHWPFSTLNIVPPLVVERITILEWQEAAEEESVRYDAALILSGEDGRELAISPQLSIAGGLEVTFDPSAVADLRAEYTERTCVPVGDA